VSTERGNNTLTELVNGLVGQGLITFTYSPDPNLHPKDMLDYWRISLTESGISAVNNAKGHDAA
jgi:hypothetical protein